MQFNSDFNDFVVYVDRDLWAKVTAGDEAAIDELRDRVEGLVIYFHVFIPYGNEIAVSIDDLIQHDVVKSITLHGR